MITENSELMRSARDGLKGKWGIVIPTYLVFSVITATLSFIPYVGIITNVLVYGPLYLGLAIFTLSLARNQEIQVNQLFKGFDKFILSFSAYLQIVLFTLLWTLLLIVPGIIAAISYSMTFYILVDDDTISAGGAIKKSKEMMYGYKWKYFCLSWRFFGWALLCVLTLGIGVLWLVPYMQVSFAKFYDDIKDYPIAKEEKIN